MSYKFLYPLLPVPLHPEQRPFPLQLGHFVLPDNPKPFHIIPVPLHVLHLPVPLHRSCCLEVVAVVVDEAERVLLLE